MMKRNILLIVFALITIGALAQGRVERKAVRSGNKSYKEQLYGTAETEYKKALEASAGSKEASFNLANTYFKQQNWDEALQEYQHYLTLENQDPMKMSSAWANMGNLFLKKKATEKAANKAQVQGGGQQQQPDNLQMSMESYKNALRLNPTDDDVRYNLAVVQKMIEDNQNGGGGGGGDDKNQDQEKKDDKKDQKQDQKQNQDQKQDKKDQQQEGQMSQENIEQILKAIEQDEKETQERVKQAKAQERKRQNQNNKRNSKDW